MIYYLIEYKNKKTKKHIITVAVNNIKVAINAKKKKKAEYDVRITACSANMARKKGII